MLQIGYANSSILFGLISKKLKCLYISIDFIKFNVNYYEFC